MITRNNVLMETMNTKYSLLEKFSKLKRELNLSFLFISHDLSVVKFMSDRIMLMHKGKIVEIGRAHV